jgi:hypothetical protein
MSVVLLHPTLCGWLTTEEDVFLCLQGDREDRQRIKDADVRKEKQLKEQREADDRALEARKLASMGYSVEEIIEELTRINLVSALFEFIAYVHSANLDLPHFT